MSPVGLLRVEMGLLLLGFAVAIGFQALIGRVNMHGLLSGTAEGTPTIERLQLLVGTVSVAGLYVFSFLDDPTRFPEIPTPFVLLLGGSNAGYVITKWYTTVRG